MTHKNHDELLAFLQAKYPGRQVRIAGEYKPSRQKVVELPYGQHEQVINQLRELMQPEDIGLGDTAYRLLSQHENGKLQMQVRRWLKFYSCRRREAVDMVNRHFPN